MNKMNKVTRHSVCRSLMLPDEGANTVKLWVSVDSEGVSLQDVTIGVMQTNTNNTHTKTLPHPVKSNSVTPIELLDITLSGCQKRETATLMLGVLVSCSSFVTFWYSINSDSPIPLLTVTSDGTHLNGLERAARKASQVQAVS